MQTGNFEKLQDLIKVTADLVIRLKFKNKNLEQENERLSRQLEILGDGDADKLSGKIKILEQENANLRRFNSNVTSRLAEVLSKVKRLANGVDL